MDFFADLKVDPKTADEYVKREYAPLEVGMNYNGHVVIRKISIGLFDINWLVWNMKLKKFQNLKVLRADHKFHTFKRELHVLELLRSQQFKSQSDYDRFADYKDWGYLHCKFKLETKEFHREHIFMEFEPLVGTLVTLANQCPNRKFSLESTKKIIGQILEGISFLHHLRYIHCDLKPENIFFSLDPGTIAQILREMKINRYDLVEYSSPIPPETPAPAKLDVVFDFLLGKIGDSHETQTYLNVEDFVLSPNFKLKICNLNNSTRMSARTTGQAGATQYRPPENLCETYIWSCFDIWSIGIVAMELVTGELLYDYKDPNDVTKRRLGQLHLINRSVGPLQVEWYKSGQVYKDYFNDDGQLKDCNGMIHEDEKVEQYTIKSVLKRHGINDKNFFKMVKSCLHPNPKARTSSSNLLARYYDRTPSDKFFDDIKGKRTATKSFRPRKSKKPSTLKSRKVIDG
uniref:Protein kinase domain-containing protein n=1 Tax=Panagrolaimus sp. JU765 TaxID=591449 RepID=A0AC34QJ76_9BILA